MSTNQKPVAVKPVTKQLSTRKGILYYTVGTQQMDREGNFFIDNSIVGESFHLGVLESYVQEGKAIVLEGDVLEDYLRDGFSYVDSNNGASNSMRKLKQMEAAKAETERKLAEMEARMAEMEAKATKANKPKGGSND